MGDPLAAALVAAELGEPVEPDAPVVQQLFAAIPELRAIVPYATVCLLAQLAHSHVPAVRLLVARALPWFADLYRERSRRLLERLAEDLAPRVRAAAAEALADLRPR